MSLLEVRDLSISFSTSHGLFRAVNGINLTIERGEIFGLVGETGCGKTVTGLALMGLISSTGRVTASRLSLDGLNLLSTRNWQNVRGRRISMIFQDPAACLNPTFTIGQQLSHVIRYHLHLDSAATHHRAVELLNDVGLSDAAHTLRTYPHQLSGGMQQRVMIALALASGAELLIADEPTTALDVTIQSQILRLLKSLRDKHTLTILLITHDLGVVAHTCDRVAVLYAGSVAETSSTVELFRNPKHPYTQGLLGAMPRHGSRGKPLLAIEGSLPSGINPSVGCPFAARCPLVMKICRTDNPTLTPTENAHAIACHLY